MTITMDRPQTSGNDRVRNSDYLLGTPAATKDAEAIERDRARRIVQRAAGQDAAELLNMLGLAAPPPPGPIEPVPAADEKRCSRCQKIKARTEFWQRPGAGDGLRSQCKDCSKATKRKSAARRPVDPKRQRGNDRNISWRITTPGGRGMDCSREGVNERRGTYGALIREGHSPRQAAEEMRIGMRTARRYHAELRERGDL